MKTRIIAIANQKGGVGKTTTAYHLTRSAQRQGLKVLAIDTDPQGSLTTVLTKNDLESDTIGLADVLSNQTSTTMAEVLVPALWDGVDLIPTTGVGLSLVRDELIATPMGRESKLKKAIQSLEGEEYDLILIDCPPSIDQLTINAMVAADAILIITHTHLFSMNGMSLLMDNIEQIREHYNQDLDIAGIVINQFEKNQLDQQASRLELTEAAAQLNIAVYEPVIPKRAAISKAPPRADVLDKINTEDAKYLVDIYDRYLSQLLKKA